jgi:hypothetical protein
MDNIQQAPAIHNRHMLMSKNSKIGSSSLERLSKSNALVPELKVLGESWRPTELFYCVKQNYFIIIYNNYIVICLQFYLLFLFFLQYPNNRI